MWQGRVVEVAPNDCVSPACGAEMLGSKKCRLWHGKGLGRTVLSPFGEHLGRSLSAAGACSEGPGAWQSWTHQRGGQESCRLKAQGASARHRGPRVSCRLCGTGALDQPKSPCAPGCCMASAGSCWGRSPAAPWDTRSCCSSPGPGVAGVLCIPAKCSALSLQDLHPGKAPGQALQLRTAAETATGSP